MLEFDPGVGRCEAPIHPTGARVPPLLPGADFVDERLFVRDPTIQALAAQDTQLDLGHVQPAPVLGRVMNLQLVGQALRLRRSEGLIERGRAVRIQLIHDQHDGFRLGIAYVDQILDGVRPIDPGALVGHLDPPLTAQGLVEDEQIGHAVAAVFGIEARGLPRLNRERQPRLADQLFADLVHAHQRMLGILRAGVHLQHILHVPDEVPVRFGWNAPLFFQPRLEFVFFKVRRTVSYETVSTYSSSTILSASRCKVHRACPSGGGPQTRATRWASWRPSNVCKREGAGRGSRAASRPSSTPRRRTRSTVGMLTSTAAAISVSGRPSAALSKMRAWASRRAAPLPDAINAWSVVRSVSVRVTMYFFGIAPAYTARDHPSTRL